MAAHHIFKYLRSVRDYTDEGVEIAYILKEGDDHFHLQHVTLSISNDHVGVTVAVETEKYGYVYQRFCANYTEEFYTIEKVFYDMFVMLGTRSGVGNDLIELLVQTFSVVEVRCGGGKRSLDPDQIRPKLAAALDKIKYDTKIVIEYLPQGDSRSFNYGSPDTFDYSSYEPSDEVADALQTLDTALCDWRKELLEEHAIHIQAAFKGWKARMHYAYNPHTTLGKFYAMRQFHQMLSNE